MRVDVLVSPRGRTEIFENDVDALFAKPYMTGDVFIDVPDPDATDDDEGTMAVAIVGHPCVIRGAGGQLKTRVPCCVVSEIGKDVPYNEWPNGNFDYFPLDPELGLGQHKAVRLGEFRPVHKRELTRERRAMSLTPRGVYVFQQRFTHSLTRVAFPLAAFEEGSRHILDEVELETEWVEHFAVAGASDNTTNKHVKAFHRFLDEEVDGARRRDGFKQPGGSSAIARAVRAEMKRVSGS